jgi:hypothetical protein
VNPLPPITPNNKRDTKRDFSRFETQKHRSTSSSALFRFISVIIFLYNCHPRFSVNDQL